MYLISPRGLHNLFDPVGKVLLLGDETVADIGIADRLKDPEHSSGSPAITSRPEPRVRRCTDYNVLPQLGRGILEVLAV